MTIAPATVVARPPSPPHSTDGDLTSNIGGNLVSSRDPCTPRTPQSSTPQWSAVGAYVSATPPYSEVRARPEVSPPQDTYGDPLLYQTGPSQQYYTVQPVSGRITSGWHSSADVLQTYVRSAPYYPRPAPLPEVHMQTRSGRAITSPTASASPRTTYQRSPRVRKTRNNKKTGGPAIDQPLSVLTKDYQMPIRDMHAWVHRSADTRQREAEDKKGYVTRPMNSFMLYRSAYADRVKQFAKENNHQVVSQVTGLSWTMETPDVKEMFEKLAIIERDNHATAHPNYKFAPNKNGKKRQRVDDDDSDDDPDWDGASRVSKRSRSARQGEFRSNTSTPYQLEDSPRPQQSYQPMHPSSYQANNPYGPAPFMIGPDGLGQYYQTVVQPYGQQIDDVRFSRMPEAYQQVDIHHSNFGMPNGGHADLMAAHQLVVPDQVHGEVLDPRLAQLNPNVQFTEYDGLDLGHTPSQHYGYTSYTGQSDLTYTQHGMYHPGLATLTDSRVWTEQEGAGTAFDEELQKWN